MQMGIQFRIEADFFQWQGKLDEMTFFIFSAALCPERGIPFFVAFQCVVYVALYIEHKVVERPCRIGESNKKFQTVIRP